MEIVIPGFNSVSQDLEVRPEQPIGFNEVVGRGDYCYEFQFVGIQIDHKKGDESTYNTSGSATMTTIKLNQALRSMDIGVVLGGNSLILRKCICLSPANAFLLKAKLFGTLFTGGLLPVGNGQGKFTKNDRGHEFVFCSLEKQNNLRGCGIMVTTDNPCRGSTKRTISINEKTDSYTVADPFATRCLETICGLSFSDDDGFRTRIQEIVKNELKTKICQKDALGRSLNFGVRQP